MRTGGRGDCPGVSPRRAPSGVSLSLVGTVKAAINGVYRDPRVRQMEQVVGPLVCNGVAGECQSTSKGNEKGLCPILNNVLDLMIECDSEREKVSEKEY